MLVNINTNRTSLYYLRIVFAWLQRILFFVSELIRDLVQPFVLCLWQKQERKDDGQQTDGGIKPVRQRMSHYFD